MKRTLFGVAVALVSVMIVSLCFGGVSVPGDYDYNGRIMFAPGSQVNLNGAWKIDGTEVTVTAAQLNSAGAGSASTLTPTLISNATLKVYGSNLEGKAGGTVTLPAASIAAAALPASITASTLLSNDTLKVYGSNIEVKTGGTVSLPDDALEVGDIGAGSLPADVVAQNLSNDTAYVYGSNLTVKAGGTVTLPADSVSLDAVNGITASASEINSAGAGSTATLTPTLISNATLKVYGSNLEVVAGGTVSLPDDALQVADIGAGSLPTDVIAQNLSNDTAQVYGSNLTVVAGGVVAINGKEAVVASSTTRQMIQSGTFTNGSATVAFSTAFGATPVVVCTWQDDVTGVTSITNGSISATAISTTTFVPKTLFGVDTATNIGYIAIGQLP